MNLASIVPLLPSSRDGTVVRRFRITDLDRFRAYRGDPGLARFQGWTPMTRAEARAFVGEMAEVDRFRPGDWIQLAIAEAPSDGLIGDLGIFLEADGSIAELGFTLGREAQGRGHATRAVAVAVALIGAATPAREVRAISDVRNTKSIGVLERAAFRQSHVREAVFKGEPCREIVFVRQMGNT